MEWYRGIGIRKEDRCRIKNFDFKNWESQTWEGKDQSPFRLLLYTCQVQSTFVRRLLEHEPLGREMWLAPVQWKTHTHTQLMNMWDAFVKSRWYLFKCWLEKENTSFNHFQSTFYITVSAIILSLLHHLMLLTILLQEICPATEKTHGCEEDALADFRCLTYLLSSKIHDLLDVLHPSGTTGFPSSHVRLQKGR